MKKIILFFTIILCIFVFVYFVYKKDKGIQIINNELNNGFIELRKDLHLSVNNKIISVQKVESQDEHQKGLSIIDEIKDNEGMLFLFKNKGFYYFWMKDMKFSIDIIWISGVDSSSFNSLKTGEFIGEIVDIKEDLSPSSFPESFTSNREVNMVLEVKSGFVKNNNLETGQKIFLTNEKL